VAPRRLFQFITGIGDVLQKNIRHGQWICVGRQTGSRSLSNYDEIPMDEYGIVACFFASTSALAQSTRSHGARCIRLVSRRQHIEFLRALEALSKPHLESYTAVSRCGLMVWPFGDHGHTHRANRPPASIGTESSSILTAHHHECHVVEGAQRVRVILPSPPTRSIFARSQPIHATRYWMPSVGTQTIRFGASQGGGDAFAYCFLWANDVRVRQGSWVFESAVPKDCEYRNMGVVS